MSENAPQTPLPVQPPMVPLGRASDLWLHESTAAVASESGSVPTPSGPSSPSATPGTGPDSAPSEMATGRRFDEAATRNGISILVETADATAADHIRKAASAVVETPAQADAYADRVKLPGPLKESAVESLVKICAENDLNIGPGWAIGGIALEWIRRISGVTHELESLARLRRAAATPPTPKDAA